MNSDENNETMYGFNLYNHQISNDMTIKSNKEKLKTIENFADMIPYYDEKNGYHLKLHHNKTEEIYQLPHCASYKMNVSKSNIERELVEATKKQSDNAEMLIRNIYSYGWKEPSMIQKITLLPIIEGKDLVVQFNSGMGKTGSFLVGSFWGFDISNPALQHICISSTHQIADQIYKLAKELLPEANIVLCRGQGKGGPVMDRRQMNAFKESCRNAQIVIGTIGKIRDLISGNNRVITNVNQVRSIIVDEFDQIINGRQNGDLPSTMEQLHDIINRLPIITQKVFFSATISNESLNYIFDIFRCDSIVNQIDGPGEPMMILLSKENQTLEGIKHTYFVVSEPHTDKKTGKVYDPKFNEFMNLFNTIQTNQIIIFVNKIETSHHLYNMIIDHYTQTFGSDIAKATIKSIDYFNGDMTSEDRDRKFADFKSGKIKWLITTDSLARGIDVSGISLVFNYDLPRDYATYVHRIGRSGRFGRIGYAISIAVKPYVSGVRFSDEDLIDYINQESFRNPITHLSKEDMNLMSGYK